MRKNDSFFGSTGLTRRQFNLLLGYSTASMSSVTHIWAQAGVPSQWPVHFVYESNASRYGLVERPTLDEFEKIHLIEGDITWVWYNELYPLWQEGATSTAGLTRETEFFLLKTLARDHGYRVVHEKRIDHTALCYWLLMK